LNATENRPLSNVQSKDGTIITFDKLGDGPPVILVCGGSVDRMSNAPLADALAPDFTVYNYDRRGRGASGDTPPYAVEREIEDIEALVNEAGGSAFLYGSSSGAALALDAAASGLPITKLALWEPPYILEGMRSRPPANTAKIYNDFIAEGRRDAAAEYFMVNVVGLPQEFAAQARNAPWWPGQLARAHTLAYDATIMGDYSLPFERAASVTTPTVVLAGGASFGWIISTAQKLVETMPNAQYRNLEGQTHDVSAQVMAAALVEFFSS
jgi:pimeloyl-ACP methyl ester carboxylesterase